MINQSAILLDAERNHSGVADGACDLRARDFEASWRAAYKDIRELNKNTSIE